MPRHGVYATERAKTVTMEQAEADVSNAAYAAVTGLFEGLEFAGRVRGNGHHMAQDVAKFASELVKKRWIEEKAAETKAS